MKNDYLNIITREDYRLFREVRKVTVAQYGEKLNLMDPETVRRIETYAKVASSAHLRKLCAALEQRSSWRKIAALAAKQSRELKRAA